MPRLFGLTSNTRQAIISRNSLCPAKMRYLILILISSLVITACNQNYRPTSPAQSKNYTKIISDIKTSISNNPGDAGKNFTRYSSAGMSENQIKEAEKQIKQMFTDRRSMTALLSQNDTIVRWLTRKFAGEDTGFPIQWDPTPPYSGKVAEHQLVNGKGVLRISPVHTSGMKKGRPLGFEDLWVAAVFELYNLTNSHGFYRLHNEALSGEISKQDYVHEHFVLEHRAMQLTRAFYAHVFLSWARDNHIVSNPILWYTSIWGGPDKWLQTYHDNGLYHADYFGDNYSALTNSDN